MAEVFSLHQIGVSPLYKVVYEEQAKVVGYLSYSPKYEKWVLCSTRGLIQRAYTSLNVAKIAILDKYAPFKFGLAKEEERESLSSWMKMAG